MASLIKGDFYPATLPRRPASLPSLNSSKKHSILSRSAISLGGTPQTSPITPEGDHDVWDYIPPTLSPPANVLTPVSEEEEEGEDGGVIGAEDAMVETQDATWWSNKAEREEFLEMFFVSEDEAEEDEAEEKKEENDSGIGSEPSSGESAPPEDEQKMEIGEEEEEEEKQKQEEVGKGEREGEGREEEGEGEEGKGEEKLMERKLKRMAESDHDFLYDDDDDDVEEEGGRKIGMEVWEAAKLGFLKPPPTLSAYEWLVTGYPLNRDIVRTLKCLLRFGKVDSSGRLISLSLQTEEKELENAVQSYLERKARDDVWANDKNAISDSECVRLYDKVMNS